jgi:hypothetical protein
VWGVESMGENKLFTASDLRVALGDTAPEPACDLIMIRGQIHEVLDHYAPELQSLSRGKHS